MIGIVRAGVVACLALAASALVLGCTSTCLNAEKALCEACGGDMDDAFGESWCLCIETKRLTSDDLEDDGIDLSDDESQMYCDQIINGLLYSGSDEAASCREQQAFISKWDNDACDWYFGS